MGQKWRDEAIIRDFKFKPNSIVVESVLVAHAYKYKQLQLESKPIGNINRKFYQCIHYLVFTLV